MRLRFRLRTLLVVLTIASAGLGWYVANAREHEAELRALDALQSCGGAGYIARLRDGEEGPWCGYGLIGTARLTGKRPRVVHRLLAAAGCDALYRVESVSIGGERFGDDAIDALIQFRSVQEIVLDRTSISGEGLERLRAGLPGAKVEVVTDPSDAYFDACPDDESDNDAGAVTGVSDPVVNERFGAAPLGGDPFSGDPFGHEDAGDPFE